jgi:hypothetical protein
MCYSQGLQHGAVMRKAKRNALKLESRVQLLSAIKVNGTADERPWARRALANGLSDRYQHRQRVSRELVQTAHMLKGMGVAMV